MSFIDQLMAVRGLNVKDRLFDRMTTPPINANPNISTLRDGGYGANLLPAGAIRPQVNVGLMGQVRPQSWETYDINKPGGVLPPTVWESVKQTVSKIGKKPPRDWDKELEDSLIEHEGYRGQMYRDTSKKKVPTVGIGHTAKAGGPDPKNYRGTQTSRRMSMEEAKKVFRQDLKAVKKDTESLLKARGITKIHPQAKNILTEMVFQMGKVGVGKWDKTLKAIKAGDYKEASKHMLFNFDKKGKSTKTTWHTQTPGRANRLAKRMRNI